MACSRSNIASIAATGCAFTTAMLARIEGSDGAVQTLVELLPTASELAPTNGVVDADRTLTCWPQVWDRARQFALWLRDRGVRPGDRVVIAHPKSLASFVAMHGTIAAGAVAVPVDPLGPVERLNYVLGAVEALVLVTAAPTLNRIGGALKIDSGTTCVITGVDAVNHDVATAIEFDDARSIDGELPAVAADDRAYVIFTSGSTGQPKGIVHTHRSALAYATQAVDVHRLDTTSRLAGTSQLHFDMSTLELYAVPLAGATAVTVRESDLLFHGSLAGLLVDEKVTHLYAVPFLLKQLLENGGLIPSRTLSTSQVAFGGEQVSVGFLNALAQMFTNAELLNVYGPAEVNGVTSHSFGEPGSPIVDTPIGRPWRGVATMILDDDDTPVSDGVIGELVVNSPSLMQGYWRGLGIEVRSSHGYHTGDLVRRDAQGVLHFVGRRDHQVKVRGTRIELEEVERIIADAPGVAHVCVGVSIAKTGGEALHAWVIPMTTHQPPTIEQIRTWCRPRLASVATPASMSLVAEMPTTQSGKLDRRALLATLDQ